MKHKSLLFTLTAAGALLAGTSAHAATVFLLNISSPKTLASNESDASVV